MSASHRDGSTVAGIDLHLHTTASDGRSVPAELVAHAAAAGLTVIAVTDHDTIAAVRDTQAHAATHGIDVVPGIEVTAVEDGQDVHVLGYFIDIDDAALASFLTRQRADRLTRVEAIGRRLTALGMPIDADALLRDAGRQEGRSIGRPQVARAMIAAGHVADLAEAFDRWLGRDRPAFVPRTGPPPETVVAVIHRAGGLASLAHPGRTAIDSRIPSLCAAGLDALEVYHPDHDASLVERYDSLAAALGVLTTGGSDFHGDPARSLGPGAAMLPVPAWERLRAARQRHAPR